MSEPSRVAIDAFWESLAPHVEWPEGFSLVLLFASQPVDDLRGRLEQGLRTGGQLLTTLRPVTAKDIDDLLPQIVAAPSRGRGALWVELWAGGGDPAWDVAVRRLLERLNERRYLLERDAIGPMILVLPRQVQPSLHAIAPDLWTIRSFSAVVPEPGTVPKVADLREPRRHVPTRTSSHKGEVANEGGGATHGQLASFDHLQAAEAALAQGDLEEARHRGTAALSLALWGQAQAENGGGLDDAWPSPESLGASAVSDAGAAAALLGEVELREGQAEAAIAMLESAVSFYEALEAKASRWVLSTRPRLGVLLRKIGEAWFELGDAVEAERALRRSIEVLERQVRDDSRNTEGKRELSVSLKWLGDVQRVQGERAAARQALLESSVALDEPAAPRVFISYSHDSAEHELRVRALADRLRNEGIDARLDQYARLPSEGWLRWTEREIVESDFVLVVCTPTYRARFEDDDAGKARGEKQQIVMVERWLYNSEARADRILPILFDGDDPSAIPLGLRSLSMYRLPDEYDDLYRRLTSQLMHSPLPFGRAAEAPPKPVTEGDLGLLIETLARTVHDAGMAQVLVARIGFPRQYLPHFTTPLAFWTRVVHDIAAGRLQGGPLLLAEEAAKEFPGNTSLQLLVGRLGGR